MGWTHGVVNGGGRAVLQWESTELIAGQVAAVHRANVRQISEFERIAMRFLSQSKSGASWPG